MRRQKPTFETAFTSSLRRVTRSRWALLSAGVVVGALLGYATGLLVAGKAQAEWVEAAGTWVGGLGTIAAVLASVRALLVDQRNRAADVEREAEEERQQIDADARLVRFSVDGGGGFGPPDNFTMTSIHVRVQNGASSPLSGVSVVIGDGDFTWSPEHGLVSPWETIHATPEVDQALPRASHDESTGRDLTSYSATLRFTIEGQPFEVVNGGGEPRRVGAAERRPGFPGP